MKDDETLDRARPFVYNSGMQDAAAVVGDETITVFRTVAYVAKVLSVHPRTVRGWIANGELRAVKLGSNAGYRITDAELRAYLDRNQT